MDDTDAVARIFFVKILFSVKIRILIYFFCKDSNIYPEISRTVKLKSGKFCTNKIDSAGIYAGSETFCDRSPESTLLDKSRYNLGRRILFKMSWSRSETPPNCSDKATSLP